MSGGPRVLALLAALAGCARPPVAPPIVSPAEQVAPPAPGEVEHVVFLVGDPGKARADHYPIMPRLQQDIEGWAEQLAGDSTVSVLFLGDLVYPLGLHAPGTKDFPHDSAIVMDQVRLLAGPSSIRRHAQGYFMAGNHDWGLKKEYAGFVRLKTLDNFLQTARQQTGAHVRLAPEAGTGGPYVVDVGRHLRLLILDTAWWVLAPGAGRSAAHLAVLREIESAMASAGGRSVVIAAHHPFKSAGPHGGEFSSWRTLGIQYLLARSGAILQDLNSIPYRELERGLRSIFARVGPPLVFAGGHEHSLQVIGSTQPTDPVFSIVSGSASKLSSIGTEEGMVYGRAAPGYMRLVAEKNGGITLFVESAPNQLHTCPEKEPHRERCMRQGVFAFQTLFSKRLR